MWHREWPDVPNRPCISMILVHRLVCMAISLGWYTIKICMAISLGHIFRSLICMTNWEHYAILWVRFIVVFKYRYSVFSVTKIHV